MSNTHKKWCECCKVMIPYNRAAIQDHEASHKHKKNHEKALRAQHIKARKEHGNYQSSGGQQQRPQQKQKQQQKSTQIQQQQDEGGFNHFEDDQFLKADDQVADKDHFLSGRLWILEREDDTGKLRFRNTLTGKIEYNKPTGLLLEDYEEEEWEKYQNEAPAGPTLEAHHKVNIGQWEEVKQGEGFFDKFKADSESEDEAPQENFMEKLEKRVADGEITRKSDVIKEIILQGSTDQNLFRERLRELAEKDIDINVSVPQQYQKPRSPPKNTGALFKKRQTNTKETVKISLNEDD